MSYTTQILTTDTDLVGLMDAWERLRQQQTNHHIEQHLDWGRLEAQHGRDLRVLAVYTGDRLVATAPLLLRQWSWVCRLGYRPVARFPMAMARLGNETPLLADDPGALDAFLEALATPSLPYQILHFEGLATDSPLWQRIQESPAIRRNFWTYLPFGITPRWRARLEADFATYLDKSSPKTRARLRSKMRKLEKACPQSLQVIRITRREQLPLFLEKAGQVSARSWQGTQLGQVVRDSETERRKLGWHADRGWLRAYLLCHGEAPLAFTTGFQADGVFHYEQAGYDPTWMEYSPGLMLLYRILEDLHMENQPQWLDFGYGDNQYKRLFGTHCHEEASLYLIRKSLYTGLARATHGALTSGSHLARTSLDRLGLRERVRRLLRRRALPQPSPST